MRPRGDRVPSDVPPGFLPCARESGNVLPRLNAGQRVVNRSRKYRTEITEVFTKTNMSAAELSRSPSMPPALPALALRVDAVRRPGGA